MFRIKSVTLLLLICLAPCMVRPDDTSSISDLGIMYIRRDPPTPSWRGAVTLKDGIPVLTADPDRLQEEKRRGITIELGFASLQLPGGQLVGIVDVPGHEKFIKNMVAGASGIDLVAMIIAADEGVMPQTREHLEICTLLGINHGLVLLTKIDLVDEEFLELVKEDIHDFTRGTFLEKAPVLPVSSITGQGVSGAVRSLKHSCAVKIPVLPEDIH